jgi:hypothetical protein
LNRQQEEQLPKAAAFFRLFRMEQGKNDGNQLFLKDPGKRSANWDLPGGKKKKQWRKF